MTKINNIIMFEKLAKYGLTGVCLALITFDVFIVKQIFDFFGEYISKNTEAMTSLVIKVNQSITIDDQVLTLLQRINNQGGKN